MITLHNIDNVSVAQGRYDCTNYDTNLARDSILLLGPMDQQWLLHVLDVLVVRLPANIMRGVNLIVHCDLLINEDYKYTGRV